MRITEIWKAALIRLGVEPSRATQAIDSLAALVTSSHDFQQWNSILFEAGQSLLRVVDGDEGLTVSRLLIRQIPGTLHRVFGTPLAESQRLLDLTVPVSAPA